MKKKKWSIKEIIYTIFDIIFYIFLLSFSFGGGIFLIFIYPTQENIKWLMIIPNPLGLILLFMGFLFLTSMCCKYELVNKIFHLKELDIIITSRMIERENKKTKEQFRREKNAGRILSVIVLIIFLIIDAYGFFYTIMAKNYISSFILGAGIIIILIAIYYMIKEIFKNK